LKFYKVYTKVGLLLSILNSVAKIMHNQIFLKKCIEYQLVTRNFLNVYGIDEGKPHAIGKIVPIFVKE
jgi:hypothetical protein